MLLPTCLAGFKSLENLGDFRTLKLADFRGEILKRRGNHGVDTDEFGVAVSLHNLR